MGYHTVSVADLEPSDDRPCDRRSISDAAALQNLAVNHYAPEPGQQLPLAYHVHDEQEEVFYVLSGAICVETPDGEFVVGPDEAFVAEPGSPHRAFVPEDADGPARVLAIGAPAVDDVHEYDP